MCERRGQYFSGMSKIVISEKKNGAKNKTTENNDMHMSFEIFLIVVFSVEKKRFRRYFII